MVLLLNHFHSKVEKLGGQTMGQSTVKSGEGLYDLNNFNTNWGWRGELFYFIIEVQVSF